LKIRYFSILIMICIFSHAGAGLPPTLTTPSLPEESQTTDDLLEKI
jgi:hypothetical protein